MRKQQRIFGFIRLLDHGYSPSSALLCRAALLATVLLWGLSAWNGTVMALLLAVYHGQMAEGLPLQTRYTGIHLVDIPIALLVGFFFHGTNGQHIEYQIFLLDAYSVLQSAFVWLYIESCRAGAKPKRIA